MAKKDNQPKPVEDDDFNFIVRIANSDIDGQKRTVIGLQSIKGVGKRVADIIAKRANIDPSVKIGSLSDEKVAELEKLVTTYVEYAPEWAINRQNDYETGNDMHLLGNDLDLIQKCCALAVDSALAGVGGVVGKDEDDSNTIRACEFERVKGGK